MVNFQWRAGSVSARIPCATAIARARIVLAQLRTNRDLEVPGIWRGGLEGQPEDSLDAWRRWRIIVIHEEREVASKPVAGLDGQKLIRSRRGRDAIELDIVDCRAAIAVAHVVDAEDRVLRQ